MTTFSRWITFILLTLVFITPVYAQNVINADNAATIRLSGTMGYGYINTAQTSPIDGKVAVATGGGLWLFSPDYQTVICHLHQGAVNDVAWRTDGTELAGALVDGTVRVWDVATCEERLLIDAHTPAQPDKDQPTGATVVIWSTDHSQIISGGSDHAVNIWESRNGSSFFNLLGHTQPVTDIGVSLSGRLVSASDRELFVWNTMRGQAEPIDNYHSVASWSSDSRYLLTQDGANIVILDGDTLTAINTFPQASDRLKAEWVGSGTSFIVTGMDTPSVLILDAWLNIERGRAGEGVAQAFTVANNGVDISVWHDGQLTVWSTFDNTIIHQLQGWQSDAQTLVWLDNQRVGLLNGEQDGFVWDIQTQAPVDNSQFDITLSQTPPATTAQIATSEQGNVLSIFDAQGNLLGQYPTPFEPSSTDYGVVEIVSTPNGDVIAGAVSYVSAIGETVHAVVLWNAQTGAQLAQISGQGAPVVGLAFSPDGTRLATLDINGVANLWMVN